MFALIGLVCDEARRIWCYRWLAMGVSVALLTLGGALVLSMPPVYDAWGQILVTSKTPAATATQGVTLGDTGSPYVVAKTMLNDDGMEQLVKQLNRAGPPMSRSELLVAAALLKRRIQLTPDQGDGFFEFHVRDRDPARARRIAQLLMDNFVARNLGRSQVELRQTSAFLDTQIAAYDVQLAQSRARLAAFQQQHPAIATLAAEPQDAPADPEATVELAEARAAYQAAVAQAGSAAGGATAGDSVATLESKLAALRAQYTDQHPDVVAARRALEDARAAREAQASAPAAADPALQAARARLEAAIRRAAPRRTARPVVSPILLSEWADLQKSDELLRGNYQQLVSRREAARMSQATYGAEIAGQYGRYQITRRPIRPQFPVGPKRMLFLGAVVVLAVGGGLGAAYLAAAIRGIFVSPRELEQAFQLPVVGTVSWEPAWSTAASTRPGGLAAARAALSRKFGRRRNRKGLVVSQSARAS